jgi:hypothetical protein
MFWYSERNKESRSDAGRGEGLLTATVDKLQSQRNHTDCQ